MVQYLSHKFERSYQSCLFGRLWNTKQHFFWVTRTTPIATSLWLYSRAAVLNTRRKGTVVRAASQFTPRAILGCIVHCCVCTIFAPLSFIRHYRISSEYSGVSTARGSEELLYHFEELLYHFASQNYRFLLLFFCYLGEKFIQDYVGRSEGKNHLEYVSVEVRIILKWIFQKLDGEAWTGSGLGQVAGFCECGDEPLACIKCGEFLD